MKDLRKGPDISSKQILNDVGKSVFLCRCCWWWLRPKPRLLPNCYLTPSDLLRTTIQSSSLLQSLRCAFQRPLPARTMFASVRKESMQSLNPIGNTSASDRMFVLGASTQWDTPLLEHSWLPCFERDCSHTFHMLKGCLLAQTLYHRFLTSWFLGRIVYPYFFCLARHRGSKSVPTSLRPQGMVSLPMSMLDRIVMVPCVFL